VHILVIKKWIDLLQTKTKIITDLFYTYCRIHFTSENASFCDNSVFCNYQGGPRVSATTWPCT